MKKGYKVYLTDEERIRITDYARKACRSISEFLRFAALKEIDRHKAKQNPVPTSDGLSEADYEALAERLRHYL
jgi:hypothetical protein